jgi:hypothetical protein
MTASIPSISLSHGQLLWCLGGGRPVRKPLPDQIRYLRQIGIPYLESEEGEGRGVRVDYGFYELMEVGLACEALRQRVRPKLLKSLVDQRPRLQSAYRKAYRQLSKDSDAFKGDPNSHGLYEDDLYVQIESPYSDKPGDITFASQTSSDWQFGDLVRRQPGQEDHAVIPLKTLMTRLLTLAPLAPETRPGPKG